MSSDRDIRMDLDLESETPADVFALADRLTRERPTPAAAFRGELRRRLTARGRVHGRPARLRLLISGYACTGSLLLIVGATSAAGIGPLGI